MKLVLGAFIALNFFSLQIMADGSQQENLKIEIEYSAHYKPQSPLQYNLRVPLKYTEEKLNKSIWTGPLMGGGSNGGGGGGGVACYKEDPFGGKKMTSLLTLEAWEWSQFGKLKISDIYEYNLKSETPIAYLQRVLWMKFSNSPRFYNFLMESIKEVYEQKNKCDTFAYTNDRGETFENENDYLKDLNCEYVQLAWRSPAKSESSKKDFKIDYNCQMYNNLGLYNELISEDAKVVNQSLLILHEAFYLIGARLKIHFNSLDIRQIVNLTISQTTSVLGRSQIMFMLRSYGLDKYFDLITPRKENQKFLSLKKERQKSYANLAIIMGNMHKIFEPQFASRGVFYDSLFIRNPKVPYESDFTKTSNSTDYIRKLKNSNPDLYKQYISKINSYHDSIINDAIPQLTNEEAFLFYASLLNESNYELDISDSQKRYNFDNLLDPNFNDYEIIEKICSLVSQKNYINIFFAPENIILIKSLNGKVDNYCQYILAAQPK